MERLEAEPLRDLSIDRLRGLAMLWVIFVHVLYWSGVFSMYPVSGLKSFLLLEMPLFFFVAGAGNSMGKKTKYIKFIRKRFLRVLAPYWIYAFFCILLTLAYSFYKKTLNTAYAVKVLVTWVVPLGSQVTDLPYLTWALWFIPVYLGIMLFFPLLMKCHDSKGRYLCFPVLWILYFVSLFVGSPLFQEIAFYSIWVYAGLFYNEIRKAVKTAVGGVWLLDWNSGRYYRHGCSWIIWRNAEYAGK